MSTVNFYDKVCHIYIRNKRGKCLNIVLDNIDIKVIALELMSSRNTITPFKHSKDSVNNLNYNLLLRFKKIHSTTKIKIHI